MRKKRNTRWNTLRVTAAGFLGVILLGAVLLYLPVSNTQPIAFTDALFTSATSVCVTGLVTVVPASQFTIFGKVILPLSMPGIMSGVVMVFMPTVSTFAIAELLTMNNIKLFGTTVQENIYNGMWNYGAALSLIMLLLIGITILFTNEEDGASNESGGVI